MSTPETPQRLASRFPRRKLSKLEFGSSHSGSPTPSSISTPATRSTACPSVLERSTEILSFEPELLTLLRSLHRVTPAQKRALENALRSTFEFFQLRIEVDGKEKLLIDTASSPLFHKIQEVFFSLSELVQKIANGRDDRPHYEDSMLSRMKMNPYKEDRISESGYLSGLSGSPIKGHTSLPYHETEEVFNITRESKLKDIVALDSESESSEFSDEYVPKNVSRPRFGSSGSTPKMLSRDRSFGRVSNYSRTNSIRNSPNMIQSSNSMNSVRISQPAYNNSFLSPDISGYEDYSSHRLARSRRGSNKSEAPRISQKHRDESYIEGFDDDFAERQVHLFQPHREPIYDEFHDHEDSRLSPPHSPMLSQGNVSQQISMHRQQLRKLEALEKLKNRASSKSRASSRSNTMIGYGYKGRDRYEDSYERHEGSYDRYNIGYDNSYDHGYEKRGAYDYRGHDKIDSYRYDDSYRSEDSMRNEEYRKPVYHRSIEAPHDSYKRSGSLMSRSSRPVFSHDLSYEEKRRSMRF